MNYLFNPPRDLYKELKTNYYFKWNESCFSLSLTEE